MPTSFETRQEVKANLRLAMPIVVAQFGTMAMGLVDTALVGRVSERALAGVALGNTLVIAVCMTAMGAFLALEPIAAQAIGAGEHRSARTAFSAAMRLAWLLSIPVMLVSWASLWLLPLLKVDPTTIPDARAYMFTRLPSVLPFFVFLAAKTYHQAAGRTRTAVEAVVLANVVHVTAGWLAVFGDAGLVRLGLPPIGLPAFGAAGAGIATSLSHALLALWMFGRARIRPSDPDYLPAGESLDRNEIRAIERKLLVLGLPIGLQLAAEVGIFSLVALLMGRIGGRAAAAHQIAINLASLSFMGALGIAQATSVRVGTAVGEGSREGTRRAGFVGIALGVTIMAFWACLFAVAPRLLARSFSPDEPVIEVATTLIRIAAFFQLADGAQVVAAGALRGAADTRWPLVLNVLVHWGLGLPIGLWLGFSLGWGAKGLWGGLTSGLVIIALSLIVRFFLLTRRAVARA